MPSIIELIKKADEYVQSQKFNAALNLYLQAINIFRKSGKKNITDEILTAYNNTVVLMLQTVDSKNTILRARDLCRELIKLTKKVKDRSDMYAVAKFHLGLIEMALENYEEAARNFEEALITFELLDYNEGIMVASKNLAECYYALGLKNKAEMYLNRARAYGSEEDLKAMDKIFKILRHTPWLIK